jgi:hypothetical protein
MKTNRFYLSIALLIVTIAASCIFSELSWSIKANNPDPLRKMIGLPSLAVGNLNPAARNPGLEQLCTSFYDVPGGYCIYFTQGVEPLNLTLACNVTGVSK